MRVQGLGFSSNVGWHARGGACHYRALGPLPWGQKDLIIGTWTSLVGEYLGECEYRARRNLKLYIRLNRALVPRNRLLKCRACGNKGLNT